MSKNGFLGLFQAITRVYDRQTHAWANIRRLQLRLFRVVNGVSHPDSRAPLYSWEHYPRCLDAIRAGISTDDYRFVLAGQ